MIHYRTVLSAGLLITLASAAFADKPAHSFTDVELKRAGWSEQQIAELRASAPKPEVQDSTNKSLPLKPIIGYSSIFDSYVPFDFVPDISWREANDRVGEIGGWRAYLKIVQDAANAEADAKDMEDERQ